MQFVKIATVCSLVLLTACAANKSGNTQPDDYVEISNPMITMDPSAPATVWVPRRYVESGVPRGGELVKKGYEQVAGAPQTVSQAPASPAAATPQAGVKPVSQPVSQPVAAPIALRSRIAVLEVGDNGLLRPLVEHMRVCAVGVLVDPAQASFLAKYSSVANQAERAAFATRLQQEYGATVAVFIAASQIAPGTTLQGEVYDAMGGGLVRTVTAVVPSYAPDDAAAKDAALGKALTEVAEKIREVAALLPWYGKVAAVDGDRVYINTGKEAGLKAGQLLKVYRGGKVVAGLGFAPGERIATVEVGGFVGANGAYGVIKDGKGVQANDLVAVE